MKTFVCLAGFPAAVIDAIGQRPAARFTGAQDNLPIARAIREPYAYRFGMADFYLQELAKRITALKIKDEASVIVAYAAYGGAEMQRFLGTFFPFALCTPIEPFYPDQAPKAGRRSTLLRHVDAIETAVADVQAKARVVRDTFSGQPMSPLLLPLRNFRSDVVRPEVAALFDNLPADADPRSRLGAASDAITIRHSLQRVNGTAFYEDDRQLRFKSPGTDRHGAARLVSEGHKTHCLINGRIRLGGPFDALFHYDCDYLRGTVDRAYPNCHDAIQAPAKATHANIAPSDAIR